MIDCGDGGYDTNYDVADQTIFVYVQYAAATLSPEMLAREGAPPASLVATDAFFSISLLRFDSRHQHCGLRHCLLIDCTTVLHRLSALY
mmetsp:Transcript_11927/g.17812  ORF Transcript_11927/g.17812 Transcript_11927/m.17812 type:complete len:89 (+) Transcript_11927:1141-1407(+)